MSDHKAPDEPTLPPGEDDDVEGHSLSLVIGLGQLSKDQRREREHPPEKDETLAPLTKPFPRMKDERGR
jgi:hypothetical protein